MTDESELDLHIECKIANSIGKAFCDLAGRVAREYPELAIEAEAIGSKLQAIAATKEMAMMAKQNRGHYDQHGRQR